MDKKKRARNEMDGLIFLFAVMVGFTLGALYYWHREIERYFGNPDLSIALLMVPLLIGSIVLFYFMLKAAVRIEMNIVVNKTVIRRPGKRKKPGSERMVRVEKGVEGKL